MHRLHLVWIIFFGFILVILFYFHLHGINLYDEGWILNSSSRFFHGEIPYRDFQYVYNPATLYVNSLFYFIFGESIVSSRIAALLNSVLCIILIYKICRHIKIPSPFIIYSILLFVFWGPTHINFIWPVMVCITCGLAAVYFLLTTQGKKRVVRYIFLAGVMSSVCFLAKQNFGAAIAGVGLTAFLFLPLRSKKNILFFGLGILSILSVYFLYLFATQSTQIYFSELYTLTFKRIIGQGMINLPYPWEYPEPLYYKLPKILLYTTPLLISLLSVILLWKKQKKILFVPAFTLFFYIFSIRPTTDIPHLAPLMAISGIPFALVAKNISGVKKIGIIFIALLVLFIGMYASFFRGQYRWNANVFANTYYVDNPKVKIWGTSDDYKAITGLNSYINTKYKNEKYTFIYSLSPALYMILGKQNPTRYDYAQINLTKIARREIINQIRKKNMKFVITDAPLLFDHTNVVEYIRKNFKPTVSFNNFQVWERR